MGRSQETFNKKEVRSKKEKKRKDKEKKKLARKENPTKSSLDDMIAYVDENGMITSTPPDPKERKKINVDDIEIGIPKSDPNDDRGKLRTGTVNFFNDSKGYGFIIDSESGQRVFVHINDITGTIKEGNKVSFEIEKGQRGASAINVKIV